MSSPTPSSPAGKAKVMKWQAKGFEVVSEATGRKLRPASEALTGPHDPAAFTREFDTIADTERALGAAIEEAAQEERLMAGTTEEPFAASAQQTESPSSKSLSSKSSGDVFNKPDVSKNVASPKNKGKGDA
ncbi:hypothetical protein E8E11_001989 [Didymella keratinophila]|nr:hypothetical protein E8E11_001989 [Didymella keratinophila]